MLFENGVVGLVAHFEHFDGILDLQEVQHRRFGQLPQLVEVVFDGGTKEIDGIEIALHLVVRRDQAAGVDIDEHDSHGGRIEIVDVEIDGGEFRVRANRVGRGAKLMGEGRRAREEDGLMGVKCRQGGDVRVVDLRWRWWMEIVVKVGVEVCVLMVAIAGAAFVDGGERESGR